MNNTVSSFLNDKTLRRIMVGSTGLGLAFMLASVAAVQFGRTKNLDFQWHWSIVAVVTLGIAWNAWFWKLIWRAYDDPESSQRGKLVGAFALLFALGAGTFIYPVRFVASSFRPEISLGLVTAIVFLSVMFTLIYKLGRGFVNADQIEEARS